jgi:sodium-dependent dicarboxylate transporter 2/3/5
VSDASESSDSDRFARLGRWAALGLFVLVLLCPNPDPDRLAPAAQRLVAAVVVMSVLWMTQGLPLGITSLLPIALFPLLGIRSTKEVCKAFFDENIALYLGGFVIALGVERWGLHRRIALHVMALVGGSPRRLVLGAMLATAAISMWISNTATTLLMLPITLALAVTLEGAVETPPTEAEQVAQLRALRRLGAALMLGIAYASSIGGFTTLIGTPTNLAFVTIYKQEFPAGPEISAADWIVSVLPMGVLMLLAAWLVLTRGLPVIPGSERFGRTYLRERIAELGPPTGSERRMLAVFLATALLWILRADLKFGDAFEFRGWASRLAGVLSEWNLKSEHLGDATVAIGMSALLFALPGEPTSDGRRTTLMDWPTARRIPWDVLLLFGGGFAVADAVGATGCADWLGGRFADVFHDRPAWVVVGGTCLLLTFLSEFTSNVATVSAVLPFLSQAAVQLEIDPRLILIPATVATSCSFMLPIGTPPNAIAFGTGRVRMGEMLKAGLILNLVGVVVVTWLTFVLLAPQFGVKSGEFPEWAVRPAP